MHPMFTEALFIIGTTQMQPKCPSTEEQIKKMEYIHTKEYHSLVKRNETGSFVDT